MNVGPAESAPLMPVTPVHWSAWLAAPMLCAAFFTAMYFVDRPPPLDNRYRLTSVEFVKTASADMPTADAQWIDSDYPVIVRSEGEVASAWFRARFSATPGQTASGQAERWAIYFPRCHCNVRVWINGLEVGDGGNFVRPYPYHRQPLLLDFAPSLLQSDNEVVMRYGREGSMLVLFPTYAGPRTAFVDNIEHRRLLHFWTPLVVLGFMGVLAVIMGLLWFQRRDEKAYGWYALMLLFWSFHHGNGLVDHMPYLPNAVFFATSYAFLGLFVVCAVLFAERFTGQAHPRFERAVLAWGALGATALIVIAIAWGKLAMLTFARTVWVPSLMLLGLTLFGLLIRGALARPEFDRISMMIMSLVVLVVGIRDWLFEVKLIWVPGSDYYLKFVAGAVLLLFAFILMRRFALALGAAESLARDLERRVAEKAAALEENFAELGRAERARDLALERERIMRDMHDGLGAHLVQALTLAEGLERPEELDTILRTALGDMRLIIDSMAPNDGDLIAILALFRERMAPTLRRAGIRLEWAVTDVPRLRDLSPEVALHILRILQEAVTNALKHGTPELIRIATGVTRDDGDELQVWLEVSDDGAGFDTNADASLASRGFGNMRERAAAISAALTITSDAGGTRIRLLLAAATPANTP